MLCDHGDDEQVRALFRRIEDESGRLDILVNNATAIPDGLTDSGPFWSKPLDFVKLLDVGLRSNYVATWLAAPMLIRDGGVVFNSSSPGATAYVHGPAYGAAKAGVDKMSHDMAHDFKPHGRRGGVGMARPGEDRKGHDDRRQPLEVRADAGGGGVARVRRTHHRRAVQRSPAHGGDRQVFYSAELAERYGVTDIDGGHPPSGRGFIGPPTEFSAVVIE